MLYTTRKAIDLLGIDHSTGFFKHSVISIQLKIHQLIQPLQIII